MLTGTEDKMEHDKPTDSMRLVLTPRPKRLTSPTLCFREEALKGVRDARLNNYRGQRSEIIYFSV